MNLSPFDVELMLMRLSSTAERMKVIRMAVGE